MTQRISRDYLVERRLCHPDQIEFIYGGVLPTHLLSRNMCEKRRFPEHRGTFNICFVANKYTPRGVDKGYDVFVEVAKVLSSSRSDVTFHVVGPFDASDIDVSSIQDRIRFYGTRYTDFFPNFYAGMDIILSPNRPFVLSPGSFDGFPTGACVEAGLCGVAVICTDPLQQNSEFRNGQEIVLVQPDVEEICEQVLRFYRKPEDLYALGAAGREAFRRVFDMQAQMQPRLDLLSHFIGASHKA